MSKVIDIDFLGRCKELEEKNRILELENALLTERAEEITLISLVSRAMNGLNDLESIIEVVLEQISIVEGIPYVACGQLDGDFVNILYEYCSFAEEKQHLVEITLSPYIISEIESGGYTCSSFSRQSKSSSVIFQREGFQPVTIMLIPFFNRSYMDGLFIFADDNATEDRLGPLRQLLKQVIEIAAVTIDNKVLQGEVKLLKDDLIDTQNDTDKNLISLFDYSKCFEALSDHMDDALFILDIANEDIPAKILYANGNACTMHGYSLKEIIGKPIAFLDAEDAKKVSERVGRPNAGEVLLFEGVHKRKDGSTFPVEVTFRLIILSGKKVGMAIDKDITERKVLEESRDDLLSELTSKNRELEQLIYAVSHDLRSPLVNVQGFSKEMSYSIGEIQQAFKDEKLSYEEKIGNITPLLESEIPESLEFIQSSILKMDSLLSAFQRLSRIGSGELIFEPLNMNDLIRQVFKKFEFRINEKDISITVEALPSCKGNEIQIDHLFSNMIENAIQYMSPKRKGKILINGYIEKDKSVYVVQDNGIGVPEEYQKRIFDMCQRVDSEKTDGLGMGLALINKILHKHGGDIRIVSTPGEGSAFYVSIPFAIFL